MTLARITHSTEYIGAAYAPSFNAGSDAITAWCGVRPEVLAPLGGARTKQQCNDLGTPWYISDHYEGKGRAADVNNWRRCIIAGAKRHGLTYEQAKAEYYRIWALYGWQNITTDGQPFPREGWHLANHSSRPQGTPGVPIHGTTPKPTPKPTIENEDPMTDAMYAFAKNESGATITKDSAPRTPPEIATVGGAPYTVRPLSRYYQAAPGQPLRLVAEGAPHVPNAPTGSGGDFTISTADQTEQSAYALNGGKVLACTGKQLAALITDRGIINP